MTLDFRTDSVQCYHGHGVLLNTVLMNEHSNCNLKFATLDIDDTSAKKTPTIAKSVIELWTTVATAASRATCETDFILKDGLIYISRVVPDMELNEEFTLDTGEGRTEQDFPTSGNVQLSLETPGLLDTMHFRERPTCDIALEADEVELEVKAVGLNMKGYVIAMGNFESVKSSNESTGIVSRVGDNVTHPQPGDKVICLERGYYNTFLRSPAQKCLKLDDDADLVEMATIGIAHGTALYALNYLACLEAKETVLIQAATGGDGVDVVLSTISGPGFHESLNYLAPFGRLIDVGRGNVLDKGNMGLHIFDRSISFFFFDLNFVLEEKPTIAARLLSDAMKLLRQGKIKPIRLDSTFHITEMEKALRYFGQG
ncbi:hypothetical protein BDV28DRAFT_149625 [Aspergillus coremiiformis]|uniref:Enoyl reductase (ER) domain-containing protein n=1 Tax=Aspergillus coremiiformis TaxID=138285 RepID=A0A5N6Z404_9EURO|nr:hypothetical protein BDV28DRAFT_149625 [Aspergillus coremiiformis]